MVFLVAAEGDGPSDAARVRDEARGRRPAVNRSIRKQRHEVARKRHRQQLQELERALERRKPSQTAAWILGITLTLFLGFVILVLVW
jgi:hypothetical protein